MTCLRMVMIVCGTALGSIGFQQTARAECFKPLPLNDLASRDVDYFKDLANWRSPIKEAKHVKRFLPPDSGIGDVVNMDFYYVTFKSPSGKSLGDAFKAIRLHFPEFARGSTGEYDFKAYGTTLDLSGYAKENQKKWESTTLVGALMTFKLDTAYPRPTSFGQVLKRRIMFIDPWGSVQATCGSDTDFIFSTVDIENGWIHPVAGNRGFGIRDAGNGNWMFYSKAVDRESDNPLNYLGAKTVFCYGHLFWLNFYSNMKDYLNRNGMPVQHVGTTNRGTMWWPFRPKDPPPKEPACE